MGQNTWFKDALAGLSEMALLDALSDNLKEYRYQYLKKSADKEAQAKINELADMRQTKIAQKYTLNACLISAQDKEHALSYKFDKLTRFLGKNTRSDIQSKQKRGDLDGQEQTLKNRLKNAMDKMPLPFARQDAR